MNSSTKIVVIKSKELITGIIIAILVLIIIISAIIINSGKKDASSSKSTNARYTPGVYSSTMTLNGNPVDIQVTVDDNNINNIEMVNLSESITTMYPLIQESFDEISVKVCESDTTENISYSSESKYTATMILKAIDTALDKCRTSK